MQATKHTYPRQANLGVVGGHGNGGRVNVGRGHNLADVRLGEQGREEGVWIGEAVRRNDSLVSAQAVTPILGQPALPSSLNQE